MANGFVPPQEVRLNAKRGLELRAKHNRGGTEVGVARARDLSNGKALSLDTLNRMNSYFARHEVDKKGEGWGVDSAGYIAWLLWGGDAGRAWAKRITREQESKEKSLMDNLTTAYFEITKADKQADGTTLVYGKATDDSLDIDQQICDAAWLDRAMPDWFKSGGNIREQHSNIAAGVAKEYEVKKDGHYILAHVVDPVSVKKIDAGVLRGFSIGIKSPRVVRDTKAANGRIIDGQIVEVSLVDRPANPNCQLILAKSVSGESTLMQVEDLIEKKEKEDFSGVITPRKGVPADTELYNRIKGEAKKKFDVYPSAYANAWLVREYKKRGGKYKAEPKKKSVDLETEMTMDSASDLIVYAKSLAGDVNKFDQALYDSARTALAQLIVVEAEGMAEMGHNEEDSIAHLLSAVHHLFAWYAGEEAEGEVAEGGEMTEGMKMDKKSEIVKETAGCDCEGCVDCKSAGGCDKELCKGHSAEKAEKPMTPKKGETENAFKARCKEAGMSDKEADDCFAKYMGAEEDVEKSDDTHKCLECGCGIPQDSHGKDDVTTAVMVTPAETPKSAEGEETEEAVEAEAPAEEISEEDKTSEESINAIVEKAIHSATQSVKAEVAELLSAIKAAETKATNLSGELAIAKSLAASGGPRRTVKPIDATASDNLTKSAAYRAKAKATTDPILAKGYKALAEQYANAEIDLAK